MRRLFSLRRISLFVALVATLGLCACGGRTVFIHPERTSAEEETDFFDCQFQAQSATGNLADSSEREDRIEEITESCMRAKGYDSP